MLRRRPVCRQIRRKLSIPSIPPFPPTTANANSCSVQNVGKQTLEDKRFLRFPRNAILLTFRRSQKKVQKRESFFGGGKTASLFFIIHSPNAHVQLLCYRKKRHPHPRTTHIDTKTKVCNSPNEKSASMVHKCPFKIVVFCPEKYVESFFLGKKCPCVCVPH